MAGLNVLGLGFEVLGGGLTVQVFGVQGSGS